MLEQLGDDAPTQDESVRVMGNLFLADLIRCDVPPDTEALFEHVQEQEHKERKGKLNLLSLRLPLLDPDAFLERTRSAGRA